MLSKSKVVILLTLITLMFLSLLVWGIIWTGQGLEYQVRQLYHIDELLTISQVQAIELPRPAEDLNRAEVVWKIYGLESTWGKNDGCRKMGKYNGFGFRQNSRENVCYETFEEVVALVHKWVADKTEKGMTLGSLLCYYNEGLVKDDCPYYRKFLSL